MQRFIYDFGISSYVQDSNKKTVESLRSILIQPDSYVRYLEKKKKKKKRKMEQKKARKYRTNETKKNK